MRQLPHPLLGRHIEASRAHPRTTVRILSSGLITPKELKSKRHVLEHSEFLTTSRGHSVFLAIQVARDVRLLQMVQVSALKARFFSDRFARSTAIEIIFCCQFAAKIGTISVLFLMFSCVSLPIAI